MKFKKVLASALALAMSVSLLGACNQDGNDESKPADDKSTTSAQTEDAGAQSQSSEESTTEEAPVSEDSETTAAPDASDESETSEDTGSGDAALKIAIVTSPSGVDDGSFNEDNYNGVLSFVERNPNSTVTAINEKDIAKSVEAVAAIVSDYDVIVTPGFQFAPIAQLALDNPEKKFILVDSFPTDDAGETVEAENIYAMTFAEQESGFFAGISAAMETKTNKVAVVNGIAYPSNVNYQFGFESGVNYANKHLDRSVEIVEIEARSGTDVTGEEVGGNYVGDFSDEAGGKQIANELLGMGVDIIFVAAGASGNGVFTAVKEKGDAMVIGCDVDQFNDGVNGDSNIMLTSGLKVMHLNVDRQLQAVADGTFKGANVVLGADTDSTGYVKEDGRHQMSEETLAKLEELYELVKDGTIQPAANFSESTPEDFPGLN